MHLLSTLLTTLTTLSVLASSSSSSYTPLLSPVAYQPSAPLVMYADLVSSTKTQVPYHIKSLPYCAANPMVKAAASAKGTKHRSSIGTKLSGSSQSPLPHNLLTLNIQSCQLLCHRHLTTKQQSLLTELIDHEYRHHWVLDSLPVLMRSTLPRNIDTAINGNINSDAANTNYYVLRGFPVGFVAPSSLTGLEKSAYALYNHVRITVRYHTDPASFEGVRIVGFEVLPFSINHELSSGSLEDVGKLDATSEVTLKTCNGLVPAVNDPTRFMLLDKRNTVDVLYTYDVDWIPSTTAWSDRWDVYLLSAASDEIHVFAIVNSLMIILFLSGIVGMIVCRTLSRDIAGYNDVYNELATLEDGDGKDESGWKLVHNDVFRPPETAPLLLSVFIGSGTQIAASISLTLLLIIMKGHTDKSSTLTAIVLLYVFCGGIGGYYSARCYKLFGGKDWKTNTISTALFFPGCLVCLFSMLNCGLAYEGAGTAVSFGMILSVFLLWVGVSTPLMFVGSYMGFKKDTITVPIKTTTLVPRVIPSDVDGGGQYSGAISILLCGILPFGSVCIELFFIMSSLWLSQIYYVFGFLFIVVLILILTCAEMSIVMTYFQLTHEDYRWWWRSFLGCSSSGMYLFLYSIWYYNSKLDLQGFLSGLVYFTYNAIIALAFALFTGSIGFFSSLIFVRKIYSVIKID